MKIAVLMLASVAFSVQAQTLKVCSYNVRTHWGDRGKANDWEKRKSMLADLIVRMDVDAVGLQEANWKPQLDYLQTALAGWEIAGGGRDDGKRKGEACPVMFRKGRLELVETETFWLSETPSVPGSKSWNTSYPRICTYARLKVRATGKTIVVFNTHLDHQRNEAKINGIRLILARMREVAKPGEAVFLTGDFNSHMDDAAYLEASKSLKDAYLATKTPPEGVWRTFNNWQYIPDDCEIRLDLTGGDPVKAERLFGVHNKFERIDYVFAGPGVTVRAFKTWNDSKDGRYPSDHYPIVATVEF